MLMKWTNINRYKQAIYLGLIIMWMATIFYFSNQPGVESGNTSGRVTKLIVSVSANITPSQEAHIDRIVRKIAHYGAYLLGGILLINYINTLSLEEKKKILYAIAIGMIYAGTDELHQYFVEGRSCMITDVFLDALGIATGVLAFWLVKKIYNEHKTKIINKGL